MDMNSRLLAGEEEQPELAVSHDGGRHASMYRRKRLVHQPSSPAIRSLARSANATLIKVGLQAVAVGITSRSQAVQMLAKANPPSTSPRPATPSIPYSSHLRLVSSAIAASAIEICNAVVACAQRWCS